jgi:DNA-binding PadR family transcriptional regulator
MALPHAIMTALLDGELSGYDLMRKFQTSLGLFWEASHQQIYQELRKLAEAGWLEATPVPQAGRPDKVVYRLTDAGQAALAEWLNADSKRKSSKDDLFVKLYHVGHADTSHVVDEIRQRRAEHEARLALYQKIRARHYADPQALPRDRQGIYLALAAGIGQEQMFIAWCDEALALLDGG